MDTGLGIKGLVIKGREVLVLRKPNGELDLPGGRVEKGENPVEALRREISEELSLTEVEILVPVASWSFLKELGFLIRGTTWACRHQGGTIQLSGEHTGFIWIKGYHLQALNLFSRFGLTRFGTWTNPGLSKMAEISLQEHFQQFHLKEVVSCAKAHRP